MKFITIQRGDVEESDQTILEDKYPFFLFGSVVLALQVFLIKVNNFEQELEAAYYDEYYSMQTETKAAFRGVGGNDLQRNLALGGSLISFTATHSLYLKG